MILIELNENSIAIMIGYVGGRQISKTHTKISAHFATCRQPKEHATKNIISTNMQQNDTIDVETTYYLDNGYTGFL